jgi:hypothetical protein
VPKRDVDFAEQNGSSPADRIIGLTGFDRVTPLPLEGVDPNLFDELFAVADAMQRARRVVDVGEACGEGVLAFAGQQVPVGADRSRVFHQRRAFEVDHADQGRRMAEGLDGAQRVARDALRRRRRRLHQEGRTVTASRRKREVAHHRHRSRAWEKRPLLGDARLALEPMNVASESPLAREREVQAQVSLE